MVEADARDDGNIRGRDDVGGVQTTAKTDLQHRNLAPHLDEMQKRYRRHELELRWVVTGFHRHLLSLFTHLQGDARKVRHADVLAIHADPFLEALDERAGEPPHPIASGLQHVGDISTRAALPVRARNMNDAQIVLRIAQALQQLADAVKAQTRSLPTGSVDIGDRIEVLRRVLRHMLRPRLRRALRSYLRHTGFTLLERLLFVSRLARDDNPSPSVRRFYKLAGNRVAATSCKHHRLLPDIWGRRLSAIKPSIHACPARPTR